MTRLRSSSTPRQLALAPSKRIRSTFDRLLAGYGGLLFVVHTLEQVECLFLSFESSPLEEVDDLFDTLLNSCTMCKIMNKST